MIEFGDVEIFFISGCRTHPFAVAATNAAKKLILP
jgi:hypothetical protein